MEGYVLDFIENNAGRLVDPKQPDHSRNQGQEGESFVVGSGQIEDIVLLNTI